MRVKAQQSLGEESVCAVGMVLTGSHEDTVAAMQAEVWQTAHPSYAEISTHKATNVSLRQ